MRRIEVSDLPACAEIESMSYPEDEAASPESLKSRQAQAGRYFYGIFMDTNQLIGFICATLTTSKELTEESMEPDGHEPDGTSLCVHSVVVAPPYRRHGIALSALKAYTILVNKMNHALNESVSTSSSEACEQELKRVKTTNENNKPLEQIILIAKGELLCLYRQGGFDLVGLSKVVHGKDPWFEMRKDLSPSYFIIDAFASSPLNGNPAAVVFHIFSNKNQCQKIANEFNLTTAFISFRNDGDFDIRWFTPTTELEICGHATIAASHALIQFQYVNPSEMIRFHSLSGNILQVTQQSQNPSQLDNHHMKLTIEFPYDQCSNYDLLTKNEILLMFNISKEEEILQISKGNVNILIEVTMSAFLILKPNFFAIQNASTISHGIIITTKFVKENLNQLSQLLSIPPVIKDDDQIKIDFLSRYFAPKIGINEDSVTGSAHRTLSSYWSGKLGQNELVGWQASSRGGLVSVATDGVNLVHISGTAVTTMEGRLYL